MTHIVDLVNSTALDLTPGQLRLPPLLWSAFTAINRVHGLWRWYRREKLYSNPNNFSQLLAGHAVNLVFGETLLLKVAAQSLLIATRILECTQRQRELYMDLRHLLEAIKGRFPAPIDQTWIKQQPGMWISPSSAFGWRIMIISARNRISRIGAISLNVCKKVFVLSMAIMDATDAFYLSPATHNEGINEGFINVIKWLDAIVDQKETLLQGLNENRELVERILKNSPFSFDQLQQTIAKALEKTEAIHTRVKKINSFGNGLIVDFGKRAINGGMVVAGLADFRPLALAPKPRGWQQS